MKLPLLISMGDAAGIGAETIVSGFAAGQAEGCVVVGDVSVMRRAVRMMPDLFITVAAIETPADAAALPPRCLAVIAPPGMAPGLDQLPWGVIDARNGAAAARCIEHAATLVQAGQAAAMVTAPIHKEALAAAGVPFPGHTEMLQALATQGGVLPPVRMMLANDELRVVLVTSHLSLRRAIEAVTLDAVLETIRITQRSLAAFGLHAPRIAVAGLNPHAGENGLFGDEEQAIIAPAVRAARAEGIEVSGPYAPDTIFMRARHAPGHVGEFDAVVAMTHDHGLIPVKYLGVEQGVNVTLGLPFVRTSPDHGTAFDIAGRGLADPSSLIAAIRMARRLS